MTLIDRRIVERYTEAGWWGRTTLGEVVARRRAERPHQIAYIADGRRHSWLDYDEMADRLSTIFTETLPTDSRLAVILPDSLAVHAVLVAAERSHVVSVGIGVRAGDAEIAHLMMTSGAVSLVSAQFEHGRSASELRAALLALGVPLQLHLVLDDGVVQDLWQRPAARAAGPPAGSTRTGFGPNEMFMLNSTSGTTGQPKCVIQFQNRWMHFVELARDAGQLTSEDVFMASVPAPYGFGLWTSHFAPAVIGAPTVLLPRFNADRMVQLIAEEKVTTLFCVSTQFRMLLESPLSRQYDLSSLRVMFTGGEAVPYEKAAEFEDRTGAVVLQFFGSNESGAFSYTTLEDSRDRRLRTAGRLIPSMDVQLYDEQGHTISAPDIPGQPGGTGPLTGIGYYGNEEGNQELFAQDGSVLMGDLVSIDKDGYLTVVGRKSDIIIRGGKNISAAHIEEAMDTHPAISISAAVPVTDAVFGERVCAAVELKPGSTISLAELTAHLLVRGMTKEYLPEYLMIVDALPRAGGEKVAKGEVRRLAIAAVEAGEVEASSRVPSVQVDV